MAPTPIHAIFSRDYDASLAELFHEFPAVLWTLFKAVIFDLSVILAFFAILFAIFCVFLWIYIRVPDLIRGLTWLRIREVAEGPRERIWRWRKIGLDRIWAWLKGGSSGGKAGDVYAEELRRLDSHDGEGREGSVSGETSLDGEEAEDEDENGAGEQEGGGNGAR